MRYGLATVCLTLSLMTSLMAVRSAITDLSVKELAIRTEVRPIEALTLSDQQFLTGDTSAAKAAVIAGELRLPQGAPGRLPAVVLMHGSGSAGAREEFWSKIFNEMGIASLRTRPHQRIGEPGAAGTLQHDPLRLSRSCDALGAPADRPLPHRAHGLLARRPDNALCDPQTFHQAWEDPEVAFAAYIPLYASCNPTLIGDTDVSGVPSACFMARRTTTFRSRHAAYVERLRAAVRDAQLTEFADTHHGYDNPLGGKVPEVAINAQSVRACI